MFKDLLETPSWGGIRKEAHVAGGPDGEGILLDVVDGVVGNGDVVGEPLGSKDVHGANFDAAGRAVDDVSLYLGAEGTTSSSLVL